MDDRSGGIGKYRIPFPLSALLGILLLPVLFLGAAISIPYTHIWRRVIRRRERRIAEQLSFASRRISWEVASSRTALGDGTLIQETLSPKGPFRLWWAPNDIAAECPFPCCPGWESLDSDYKESFAWCRSSFTDLDSGSALLVSPSEDIGQEKLDRLFEEKRCILVLRWDRSRAK